MSIPHLLMVLFWSAWVVVAYTYVVFPLALAALARRARPIQEAASVPDAELPFVTMVVAAHDEADVMERKLANSWALDYPADRFELIIGSDGSTDGTNEILRAEDDPRLCPHLFPERRGKISVVNDLVSRVESGILVMSDANTLYHPQAVRRLVRHFQDARVGCVSGELRLEQEGGVSGEGLYWRYEGWIKRSEARLGFLIGCNGGIFALRRELYQRLPASTIVEDFALSMSVLERGYEIRFDPSARAAEPSCVTSRAEMTRKIRIGAGDWQALRLTRGLLHPRHKVRAFAFWGHKVLRWCVPVLLAGALAANLALLGSPAYQALLALQIAGIAAALWAYAAGPGKSVPRWAKPMAYFYLMNYALGRGLLRFLLGTQRVTWDREPAPSAVTAAPRMPLKPDARERLAAGAKAGG